MFTLTDNTFLKSHWNDGIITFEVLGNAPSDIEWNHTKIIVDNWYNYLEDFNTRAGFLILSKNLIFVKPKHLLEWKDIYCYYGKTEEKRNCFK